MKNIMKALRSRIELAAVLASHAAWLHGEDGGVCADLSGADLMDTDLTGVALWDANLSGADLWDANLMGADLRGANLRDADLTDANLKDADLTDANLCGANLSGANLCGANLTDANLEGANLCGANLAWANLMDANLTDAYLQVGNRRVEIKNYSSGEEFHRLRQSGKIEPDNDLSALPVREKIPHRRRENDMIVIKFLYLGKCVGMLSWLGTLADPGEELGGVYPPVASWPAYQVDTTVVHNGEEVKVYSGFTHWGDIIGGSPEMLYPCGHYEIWSGDTQEAEKKECLLCANLKGADLTGDSSCEGGTHEGA